MGYWITTVNFDIVWRYFAWTNQTLATLVLWSITVYLVRHRWNVWVALLPAIFMTYVCASFLFVSGQFFGMENRLLAYVLGGVLTLGTLLLMIFKLRREYAKGNA